MDAVEINGVTKPFGAHIAVDDLSLAVPSGCVCGLIGPNGSGKTTTMRMMMSILYPDRGSIRVFGERLRGACADGIGYMPEERGLYRKMEVREIYGALKNGVNLRQEVVRWLARFQLSEWAARKVEALSKGMRQKVRFTATVACRPELRSLIRWALSG